MWQDYVICDTMVSTFMQRFMIWQKGVAIRTMIPYFGAKVASLDGATRVAYSLKSVLDL